MNESFKEKVLNFINNNWNKPCEKEFVQLIPKNMIANLSEPLLKRYILSIRVERRKDIKTASSDFYKGLDTIMESDTRRIKGFYDFI